MNSGRGWLFLLPLLTFVGAAMLLSCGGDGSGGDSFATPAPPGPFIESIWFGPGPPASPIPTPSPSSSASPSPLPTETPTPCPSFTAAAVPQGCFIQFHAVATLSDNTNIDITDANSTLWSSSDTAVLLPDSNTQGSYSAT